MIPPRWQRAWRNREQWHLVGRYVLRRWALRRHGILIGHCMKLDSRSRRNAARGRKTAQGVFEDDTRGVTFTVPFRFDAVVARWALFPAFNPSLPTS